MVHWTNKPSYNFQDLQEIVGILRHPGGCAWDMEQTHASIRRNFLEEAYEVAEAIDEGDPEHLKEELGDVLLQVVFHTSIEEDAGRFDLDAVADGICKKLIYRHPHVFGDVSVSSTGEILSNWEELKQKEKGQATQADAVDAVARSLPALWRAEKMKKKAAKAGFDWRDVSGALDKLSEELEELRAALAKMPAGCSVLGPGLTKDSVFETMFSNGLDSFVDWEAGTARFDSPEFQAILEFCASLPAQASGEDMDEYTRVASGAQLLLPVYLNDLQSIQLYRALFGGGVTFAGYPSEGGSGVSFSADNGMAMSASCKDAEGAWSFLRQVLLPIGEQPAPGLDFPVNRADFEQAAEKSMEFSYLKDETGNTVIGPDGEPLLEGTAYVFVGGQGVMLKPATQADYDQVMALYEAADSLVSRDENIWAIVREQAGACFAGDRTAEEAARAIQSRVELYLNEQK